MQKKKPNPSPQKPTPPSRTPAPSPSVPARRPQQAAVARVQDMQDSGPRPPELAGFGKPQVAPSGLVPVIEFEQPGDYVVGDLLEVRQDVGPNKSKQYILRHIPSGETVCVWGSTILDAKINALNPEPGAVLYIKFEGDVPTSRGLNPAKQFYVEKYPARHTNVLDPKHRTPF